MALTTMVGGATGGYWEIGSCVSATPPSTMMNSAITQAKMGRSMKNLAMPEYPLRLCRAQHRGCRCSGRGGAWERRGRRGRGRRVLWHWLARCAGRQHLKFLKTIDDDLLASLQAIEHHPAVVARRTDLDRAHRDLAIRVHHTDAVPLLRARDGLLRQHDGVAGLGLF